MKKIYCRLFCCATLALLAACASTPESRIQKNPELFNSFPPEAQEKIKKGDVEIGFTPDMVLMAKDKPDRKYSRKTAAGEAEVWSYTSIHTTTERQRVEARIHAPDVGGNWHDYSDWVWVDVQQQHEFEQLRIEFADGKVSAVETLSK